eukprot:m51a1_g272 putative DNA (cytosine-5-)-methyltransferase (1274) ;mRNA; f:255291-260283
MGGNKRKRVITDSDDEALEAPSSSRSPAAPSSTASSSSDSDDASVDSDASATSTGSSSSAEILCPQALRPMCDGEGRLEDPAPSSSSSSPALAPLCCDCRKRLDAVAQVPEAPGAVDESTALLEKLTLSWASDDPFEERQDCELHDYALYDAQGHMCALTEKLIESGKQLFACGEIRPIGEPSGARAVMIGPLLEWWPQGYDCGDRMLLCVGTEMCNYYLHSPHPSYVPLVRPLYEALYLCKLVVEFVESDNMGSYDEMLGYIQEAKVPDECPPLGPESIPKHANFLVEQFWFLDQQCDPDEFRLCDSPAIKRLAAFSTIKKQRAKRTGGEKARRRAGKEVSRTTQSIRAIVRSKESASRSKATTTPLVYKIFTETEHFAQQIAPRQGEEEAKPREAAPVCVEDKSLLRELLARRAHWIGEPHVEGSKSYYASVDLGGQVYRPGDCVAVLFPRTSEESGALRICAITALYEGQGDELYAHGKFFAHGAETLLGETSNPLELFVVPECKSFILKWVKCKVSVKFSPTGIDAPQAEGSPAEWFFRKAWHKDTGRFTDPEERDMVFLSSLEDFSGAKLECPVCASRKEPKKEVLGKAIRSEGGKTWYSSVTVKGVEYNVGDFAFVVPDAWPYPDRSLYDPEQESDSDSDKDPDQYPELFRKDRQKKKITKGAFTNEKPYGVGRVEEVVRKATGVVLRMRRMYRPEETDVPLDDARRTSYNELYWSERTVDVPAAQVDGLCHVYHFSEMPEDAMRPAEHPDTFFFAKCYNAADKTLDEPSAELVSELPRYVAEEQPPIVPLACLDIFAGCGGMSEGFHQTGFIESKWAIEIETAAARAFKKNSPNTTVFTEDCNILLESIMKGEEGSKEGTFPKRGEVDMIVGGPPCQGYSGMNRFSHGEYSKFRNSLVISFLSYLDWFRPRFFVLENVNTFVTYKKNLVLRLVMRALLEMNYQCCVGVLQAGSFGVPQSRRRTIILAAAPGEVLPKHPDPLHVFPHGCHKISVGSNSYAITPRRGAPFRPVTVWDALSDLPEIPSGASEKEIAYDSEPLSHFQKLLRAECKDTLYDHITKPFTGLINQRIQRIPKKKGADWRDLPNVAVEDADGRVYPKLRYTHHDIRYGKSRTGALRGVCACAETFKGKCVDADKQADTLIPWCLPHTGYRHNQWAGLYGRLDMGGYFSTTVTNPEPMGKQGRILHPLQDRTVSVRECARSQGFPDHFRFDGGDGQSAVPMHKQVGNAVPPPLAFAIGLEIGAAIRKRAAADEAAAAAMGDDDDQ